MTILILIIFLLFFIINFSVYKKVMNYVNIFLLLWCSVSILSSFGFYELYTPTLLTYIYVFIIMLAFELFSLIFYITKSQPCIKDKSNINIDWKKIDIISLICTVILVPFVLKGVNIILTFGFHSLRELGFTDSLYTTLEKLILINIIQPLILSIGIISMIEFIYKRKLRLSLLISIVNCLFYILVFAGRWILLEFILVAGIILYDRYRGNIIKLIRENKLIFIMIVFLIIIMANITNQRSVKGGEGLIYNIYIYFVGGIHLLGRYVADPQIYQLTSEHMLYGQEFFSGILTPFIIILNLFGMNLKSGIEIINEVTQQFIFVSPKSLMNNNCTMIYAFLRDFGILGLVIGPMILAYIYNKAYKYKRKGTNVYTKGYYYYCLSIMPFLLFEWMPARTSIVMIPIMIYILTGKLFRKRLEFN